MNRRNLLKLAGLAVFAPLSSFGKIFENKPEFRYFKSIGGQAITFIKITNDQEWMRDIEATYLIKNGRKEILESEYPKSANHYITISSCKRKAMYTVSYLN